jgi:Pyridoxamine 5'-phosphate oxidase
MQHDAMMDVLNDPLSQRLLRSPLVARLGYNGLDGAPRVVPVGYLWNGAAFVVCTATTAPKVQAITANPTVAMTIDTDTQPPRALLVRGAASVEIVDGVPDEYLEASRKGLPSEKWAAFEGEVRALYPQMARITIEPRWAKLLDFEKRLPSAVEELISAQS